jgi:hypothetical protein
VPPVVCEGKTSNLSASGASTYTWAAGGTGAIKTVTVTGPATYSVIGTGTNGCQANAVVAVASLPSPTITANVSAQTICVGETATLNASGASTYQWVNASPAALLVGNGLTFIGTSPSAYSWVVTGTDGNGCQGTTNVNLTVDACAGINETTVNNGVSVYPNPTTGKLNVVTSSATAMAVVTDMTGRVVLSQDVKANDQLDLSALANGVYYVRVAGNSGVSTVKVVKN